MKNKLIYPNDRIGLNWSKKTIMAAGFAVMVMVFSCQTDEMTNGMNEKDRQAMENQTVQSQTPKEESVVPDTQPQPEGGMKVFLQHVSSQINYPEEAKKAGIQGKVYVQFKVKIDGSVSDVKAIRGIGAGCDEEAVSVVAKSVRWIPAQKDGKPVSSQMVIPITFKLK